MILGEMQDVSILQYSLSMSQTELCGCSCHLRCAQISRIWSFLGMGTGTKPIGWNDLAARKRYLPCLEDHFQLDVNLSTILHHVETFSENCARGRFQARLKVRKTSLWHFFLSCFSLRKKPL